jgi:hypothetical protein
MAKNSLWFDSTAYFIQRAAAWTLGKGAIGVAFLVAGFIGLQLSAGYALLAIGVGVLANTVMHAMDLSYRNRTVEDVYREETAALLNKDANEIEIEDIKSIANGIPEKNIPANPIIKEALEKNDRLFRISMVANILTSAVIGTVIFLLGDFQFLNEASETFRSGVKDFTDLLDPKAGIFGLGAGLSSLVMGRALTDLGESLFDTNKGIAHEKIREIERTLKKRGKSVSKQQVFEIYLCMEPELNSEIQRKYNQPFAELSEVEQEKAMTYYCDECGLEEVTFALNAHEIEASELAFLLDDTQASSTEKLIARLETPDPEQEKETLPHRIEQHWVNFITGGQDKQRPTSFVEAEEARQHQQTRSSVTV